MGTDMRGHFELKINQKWEHCCDSRFGRNYDLFAKLAGIRNYKGIVPLAKPSGLPEDASIITKLAARLWNPSSYFCINAEAIYELHRFHEESLYKSDPLGFAKADIHEWGYVFGGGFECFFKHKESFPKEIEDIRFIFWFDC